MLDRALSPRDRAIIRTVSVLGQVTSVQLGRLFFADGSEPSRAPRRTRCLRRLAKWGHIARVQDRNGAAVRAIGGWSSGSEGFTYCDLESKARQPNAHTLAIVELYVRLIEAERLGRCQILDDSFEVEPRYKLESGELKPDAYVRLKTSGRFRWFIEVDRGTEYRAQLTRKVETYILALDWWPKASGPFPRVLFTASDDKTSDLIAGIVRACRVPELFSVCMYDEAVDKLIG